MSKTLPVVFRKRVYATASIAGGAICYLCLYLNISANITAILSMIITVVIRICATLFRWSLPKIENGKTENSETK